MKKKFFLNRTVDALSEKQINDLNAVFGGLRDVPVDVYYPTMANPVCPDGFYWHTGVHRCLKNGTFPAADAARSNI